MAELTFLRGAFFGRDTTAAARRVGVDRGRGLDQALAFEEGGEADVAGVVQRGGAQTAQRVEGAPVEFVVELLRAAFALNS